MQHTREDIFRRVLLPISLSQQWESILNGMSIKGASLIAGPKGSGKSTLSKLLVNRYLTMKISTGSTVGSRVQDLRDYQEIKTVFFLDLDPGQPEFSPPGQVSLVQIRCPIFGPSYTHPSAVPTSSARPIRTHTLAAMSPQNDVKHYLACAQDLYQTYLTILLNFPATPLIVNCPGWTTGAGLEILVHLIHILHVDRTLFLSTSQKDPAARVVNDVCSKEKSEFHLIQAQGTASPVPSRAAADLRTMLTMSYFHQGDPKCLEDAYCWSTLPLNYIHPVVASYCSEDSAFLGVMSYGEAVAPQFLGAVLNGSIVAIVRVEDEAALVPYGDVQRSEVESIPYFGASSRGSVVPLDPSKSHCVCLALVRSIDVERQALHLLVPLLHRHLLDSLVPDKTVLVRGDFETPSWAYVEEMHAKAYDDEVYKRKKMTSDTTEYVSNSKHEASRDEIPWVENTTGKDIFSLMGGKRKVRRFQR